MISDYYLEQLAIHLQVASAERFTGQVNLNFCDGGITRITKDITIKETLKIRSFNR